MNDYVESCLDKIQDIKDGKYLRTLSPNCKDTVIRWLLQEVVAYSEV